MTITRRHLRTSRGAIVARGDLNRDPKKISMTGVGEGNELVHARVEASGGAGPSGAAADSSDDEGGIQRLDPDAKDDEEGSHDDEDDRESLGGDAGARASEVGKDDEWELELLAP